VSSTRIREQSGGDRTPIRCWDNIFLVAKSWKGNKWRRPSGTDSQTGDREKSKMIPGDGVYAVDAGSDEPGQNIPGA